jgi:hypothetical protein
VKRQAVSSACKETKTAQNFQMAGGRSDKSAQEHAFRPHDPRFFLIDFDALGERAEVIAAVASAISPHALAGLPLP